MKCISPVTLKNPLYDGDKHSRAQYLKKFRGSSKHLSVMLNGVDRFITVPCGKCYGCMRTRCNSWVFRHLLQLKKCNTALFLTLTYNDDNLPINPDGTKHFDKTHLQKYLKRIRKYLSSYYPDVKIKYHVASEYGDSFQRPHYHLILYDYPNTDADRLRLAELWDYGNIHIGNVTEASIRYTVEYITQFYYECQFANPNEVPFALYSNGLGSSFYGDVARYIGTTLTAMYPIDGKNYKVPNSYMNILFEQGYLTADKYVKIKQNAYEYYKENSSATRRDSPLSDEDYTRQEMSQIEDKVWEYRNKYKLKKQGNGKFF